MALSLTDGILLGTSSSLVRPVGVLDTSAVISSAGYHVRNSPRLSSWVFPSLAPACQGALDQTGTQWWLPPKFPGMSVSDAPRRTARASACQVRPCAGHTPPTPTWTRRSSGSARTAGSTRAAS
jgi:hypothetical protein